MPLNFAESGKLTNHADGVDYIVAVASGVICGFIDVLFVSDLSFEKANEWGNDKVNDFVLKIAKKQGYEGEDLSDAVKFLEDKFPIAADKATNAFGGGYNHHLRDFSHHPTPVGLFFSLLTQFTKCVYGTNTAGFFDVYKLQQEDMVLIGRNLQEKLLFGVVHWFFHMVSDMAGSSGSIADGNTGTGLPGPLVSLLKELSALPFFKNLNEKGYKTFSVWISKLFNGTLLGEHDENGKIISPVKFDLRTEIGLLPQLGKQAIPIIINECVVRGFYFVRRLSLELKSNNIKNLKEFNQINWKNVLPFNNRTIPDSAKFKGIKTVKNHDDTAFYVCFGVIENFTHQVKLQAVIILPINNVISMQFSHFCQSNFADSGYNQNVDYIPRYFCND